MGECLTPTVVSTVTIRTIKPQAQATSEEFFLIKFKFAVPSTRTEYRNANDGSLYAARRGRSRAEISYRGRRS